MDFGEYVTLEVAEKLKEKGYKRLCNACWKDGWLWEIKCWNGKDIFKGDFFAAPTLYQAQKYIRLKYNIHIVIDNSACGYGWFLYKADNGTRIADYADTGPNDGGCWDTYEEALNEGILEALKRV